MQVNPNAWLADVDAGRLLAAMDTARLIEFGRQEEAAWEAFCNPIQTLTPAEGDAWRDAERLAEARQLEAKA